MCIPSIYKHNDMFVDEETESPNVLDDSTDSTVCEYSIMESILGSTEMANIQMITLTLSPQYHDLCIRDQYELLVKRITKAINRTYREHVPAYYGTFELTMAGVVHCHMLIDVGYEADFKKLKERLVYTGFIYCKNVFNKYGAFEYIMKDVGRNANFSSIHS